MRAQRLKLQRRERDMAEPLTTVLALKAALLAAGIKVSLVKLSILVFNHPWILYRIPGFIKLCVALKKGNADKAAQELMNLGRGAFLGELIGNLSDVFGGDGMKETLAKAEEKQRRLRYT